MQALVSGQIRIRKLPAVTREKAQVKPLLTGRASIFNLCCVAPKSRFCAKPVLFCYRMPASTATANLAVKVCFLIFKRMNEKENGTCPLCARPLAPPCNRHHLLPLSKGGKGTATVLLHKICHDKIHSVFTEMELKRRYNSIESLRGHEEMDSFLKWVAKKEPQFYDRSVQKKR